jgi:hypothetical protein
VPGDAPANAVQKEKTLKTITIAEVERPPVVGFRLGAG